MTALTLTVTLSDVITSCWGDLQRDHAQVHFPEVINPKREDEEEAWAFERDEAPEPEDDSSLVFLCKFDCR